MNRSVIGRKAVRFIFCLTCILVKFTPLNLGKIIKEGAISDIQSIHRVTIEGAVMRKSMKSSQLI